MIILKILTNILFIAWGLDRIGIGTSDLKTDWCPKMLAITEIIDGAIMCTISFLIWFF